MLTYHKIVQDIEKIIKGDISVDVLDLKKHSTDASLFTIVPKIIIYPKDKFDIQAVVKYVKNLKETIHTPGGVYDEKDIEFVKSLSLTARAAGTDMTGGPLNDSIILDTTKYMNSYEELAGNTIVCEPGLYFRDLEKYLDTFGLMYPSYPASKDLCCVGGIVANNSSGEKTLQFGSTKDWVEEIEMVMSDGEIINFTKNSNYKNILELMKDNQDEIIINKPIVTKNSSGYNLWDNSLLKLICGSQGTFGIITEVKLRLVERKRYSQMLTVFMPDLTGLVELVEEIMKYKPEAIETFDDHTFKIAMKFLPTIIWKLKGSIFQLGISFIPEMWMALTGGIPKLILMAEFTGATQLEANQKAFIALEHIQRFKYKSRVTKNQIELQKYWLFRRESFNLLRSKLKDFRTAPFVEDVIVPVESMLEFIPKMQKVLDKYKLIYTIAGHAGNGNFHIIPLMKLNKSDDVEIIEKCNQEIFSLVQKYHGSLSAEHNDGLVRTPYLHFMFSDAMLDLFVQVKNIFDPLGIFNPGKKTGGSIKENYAKIKLTNLK